MRFTASLAAVFVLAATFACGDGPTPPTPTPEPTVAETPAPDDGAVTGLPVVGSAPQDLEFIGPITGFMTEAQVTCSWTRGQTPESGRFQLALSGVVDRERRSVRVLVNGYTGPGSYAWDGVPGSGPEVTAEVDREYTGHAVINVDDSGGAGDMEITLTKPLQGRIYGLWECAGVPR